MKDGWGHPLVAKDGLWECGVCRFSWVIKPTDEMQQPTLETFA